MTCRRQGVGLVTRQGHTNTGTKGPLAAGGVYLLGQENQIYNLS